jgi:hypothetical protein
LALLVINAGRNNKRLRSEVAAKLKLAASASLPAPILQPTATSTASLVNPFLGFNPLSNYPSLSNYIYPSQPQQSLQQQHLQQQQQQQFQQQQQQFQQQQQNVVPYSLQQQQPANFTNM